MCSDIRALLTAGDLVIIDHVITDPQIYEAVLNACEGYTILRVLVECDLETLRRRELERGDRCPGSAEESLKYLYPKTGYDVTVDSGRMTTEEIINVILG